MTIPTATQPDLFGVAERLLDYLYEEFPEDQRPRRSLIFPGNSTPWDECCEGQLWVQVKRITPHSPSNMPNRPIGKCGPVGWKLYVEVGYITCVTVLTDDGVPSAWEVTDDAKKVLDSAAKIVQDILCLTPSHIGADQLILGGWQAQGPRGGCAGGTWDLELVIPNCLTCY